MNKRQQHDGVGHHDAHQEQEPHEGGQAQRSVGDDQRDQGAHHGQRHAEHHDERYLQRAQGGHHDQVNQGDPDDHGDINVVELLADVAEGASGSHRDARGKGRGGDNGVDAVTDGAGVPSGQTAGNGGRTVAVVVSDHAGADGIHGVCNATQRNGSGVAADGQEREIRRVVHGFGNRAHHHVQGFSTHVDLGDVAAAHPGADLVGDAHRGQAVATGCVRVDGDGQLLSAVHDVGLHVAHARFVFDGGLQPVGGDAHVFVVGAGEGESQTAATPRATGVREDAGGDAALFRQGVTDPLVEVVRSVLPQQNVEPGPVEGCVSGGPKASAAGAQGDLVACDVPGRDKLIQYDFDDADFLHQLDRRGIAAKVQIDANALRASLGE